MSNTSHGPASEGPYSGSRNKHLPGGLMESSMRRLENSLALTVTDFVSSKRDDTKLHRL